MSDLLPINATAQEHALDEATARISAVPPGVRESWSPNTCAVEALPWLAWALSVDKWSDTWSEEQKRAVIRSSAEVHRKKGTVWAVRRALASLGFSVSMFEWHRQQVPGAPYTFQLMLDVDQVGYSKGQLREMLDAIDEVKSLRSHMEIAQPIVVSRAPVSGAIVSSVSPTLTVGPLTPENAEAIDGGSASTDYQFFPTFDGGGAVAPSYDYEVNQT